MADTLDIFKALADEVRLRILGSLFIAELSVAELVSVTRLPQSTVSRHLKPLRDAGLVETRREGTSIYYRRGEALADGDMNDLLAAKLKQLPTARADEKAVRHMLDQRRKRSRDFFDKVAGRYSALTQPGGGWEPLAAAMAAGFAGKKVADLGSGEGALTLLLARFAASVTAVDQSPAMLREVAAQARKSGTEERVMTAEGDLEDLPLKSGEFDAVFLSQALHHAARPPEAVREAARVLKKHGVLVVLDLIRHDHEWVREQMADQWLGFDPGELSAWITGAGLDLARVEKMSGSAPEFSVLMAVGTKT